MSYVFLSVLSSCFSNFFFFLIIRRPPSSTRMTHSFPTRRSSDLVHLVSCRNVLIYFDRDLQNRALGLFKDSLVRGGFLGLGAKESLRFSSHSKDFTNFAYSERIYRAGALRPMEKERVHRSEEPTSELQSLMRISYAVFCLQ